MEYAHAQPVKSLQQVALVASIKSYVLVGSRTLTECALAQVVKRSFHTSQDAEPLHRDVLRTRY